jgi:hypothetical protein
MPPLTPLAFACALLGVALLVAGAAWMRAIGANMTLGSRLAGARAIPVGEASHLASSTPRPLRIVGRVRCPDPLVAPDGERLVAFHRDIEVRTPSGEWRAVERLRETRSFEIWDHAGSMAIDPARAAEPLITIPLVWEGRTDELGEELAGAIARVAREGGQPAAARAVTRTISEVDRVEVLALVEVEESRAPVLEPPAGGFVISALELDAAMRLLGGEHRRQLAFAIGVLALGSTILVVGVLLLLGGLIAGH